MNRSFLWRPFRWTNVTIFLGPAEAHFMMRDFIPALRIHWWPCRVVVSLTHLPFPFCILLYYFKHDGFGAIELRAFCQLWLTKMTLLNEKRHVYHCWINHNQSNKSRQHLIQRKKIKDSLVYKTHLGRIKIKQNILWNRGELRRSGKVRECWWRVQNSLKSYFLYSNN